MYIRSHVPAVFALLLLAGLPFGQVAKAQTDCDNPIVLSSVLISNATCGNSTGVIILNPSLGAYQFNWTPSVSVSNVAFNLQAGAYHVEIVRANNPNCTLDTTLIVNNSNGPAVDITTIDPANCMAANGRIVVAPTTLTYSWSDGGTGAVHENLATGCYFVTATASNGCYSVQKICVPNTNPLETQVVVLQNAKCDLPTGAANVIVSGGSGQYSYTMPEGPPFIGLAAGTYQFGITDIMTGCQDEASFVIDNIPVGGEVTIVPQHIRCPGETNGSVNISLDPDDHFALPYSTVITDANGNPAMAGSLLPGEYFFRISDADGCQLPLDSFEIETPPSFISQALVVPGDCQSGGQILLTLSGGTGPRKVDWHDLPGLNNAEDRQNLEPGLYSATVRDSLNCTFMVNPILVTSTCTRTDTFTLEVPVSGMDSFCMDLPTGIQPAAATFFLPGNGGSNSGSSPFGTWLLQPTGCLVYSAGSTPGMGVDTICIARNVNQPGLSDTVCVIIHIGEQVCMPIHNYMPNGSGIIDWTLANCAGDTIFCTNILNSELTQWEITDHSLPAGGMTNCGQNAGIRLDTGLHLLVIRSLTSTCSYNVRVQVNCDEVVIPTDTTYAVPDAAYTTRGESIELALLDNDIILGSPGNIGGLANLEFLNLPAAGQYTYDAISGILTYTPDEIQCGPVDFLYEITDTTGQQSQATVIISIICDKILIFNGISPNGDSLNDEWHMPGIDQYPNNEVRVFNRWGQMVFERTGYVNAEGWDGRWNGRDLPDGTYFYTIDLKDGSAVLSGFLQIQR